MYSVLMCAFLFFWNSQQLVKRYTMERMAEIFRVYCVKSSDGSITPGEYDWIPGRILRCLYDKDFRQDFLACAKLDILKYIIYMHPHPHRIIFFSDSSALLKARSLLWCLHELQISWTACLH